MNSTVNFENIIKDADAVLDCIPIVSTVTNAAQIIYKLAHRVDALSPVVPGLKTSIKIHILSKDNFYCFFASIPIVGNLIALSKLVTYVRYGCKSNLQRAFEQENAALVGLCLANNALNHPRQVLELFKNSLQRSNNKTFQKVLYFSRNIWKNHPVWKENHPVWMEGRDIWKNHAHWMYDALLFGLNSYSPSLEHFNIENVNNIFDAWDEDQKTLKEEDLIYGIQSLKDFVCYGQSAIADRILKILPENIPFDFIKNILLKCSCALNDEEIRALTLEETDELIKKILPANTFFECLDAQSDGDGFGKADVLTPEQRNKLIAKSAKPSAEELNKYCCVVENQLKEKTNAATLYRQTHIDTLCQLLDKAELEHSAIYEFICRTLKYNELNIFPILFEKYQNQLTDNEKTDIFSTLRRLAT